MLRSRRKNFTTLEERSPLRALDPRSKLVVSLCFSLVVMLPVDRLIIFMVGFLMTAAWAQLLGAVLRQFRKLFWVLLVLFFIDWLIVGIDLAVSVTLRLAILSSAFIFYFNTTTTTEFRHALEKIHLSPRFAFIVSLAFQSLNLFEIELKSIYEAQRVRGALPETTGLRAFMQQIGNLIALTVPAVVLATRRAWGITEAAYTRGFDSPHRTILHPLKMNNVDWLVIFLAILLIGVLYFL